MSAASSTTAESDLLSSLFERLPYVLGINLAIALCTVIAFSMTEPPGLIVAWFRGDAGEPHLSFEGLARLSTIARGAAR